MIKVCRHLFFDQPELPPMPAPLVYIVARNGVFLWARREGLEALVPVARCFIRDLFPVQPFVRLCDGLPPVDASLLTRLLSYGSAACGEDGIPVETLFLLSKQPDAPAWQVRIPLQRQMPARVELVREALDDTDYARVLLEIHTHPLSGMRAYFSSIDDEDERLGFRLYGVLGHINRSFPPAAEIRLRVGVYGTFYEFPASQVLILPPQIRECQIPTGGTPR